MIPMFIKVKFPCVTRPYGMKRKNIAEIMKRKKKICMSEAKVKYITIPYHEVRRATIGVIRAAKRNNMIHSPI